MILDICILLGYNYLALIPSRNGSFFMKKIICRICNKSFEVPQCRKAKYCSRGCFGKFLSRYMSGEKSRMWAGGKRSKKCLSCNKVFYFKINRQNTAKYCSFKCRGIGNRNSVMIACGVCKNKFPVSRYHFNHGGGKYCSRLCFRNRNGVRIKKLCAFCQQGFFSRLRDGKTKYCSKRCMSLKRRTRLQQQCCSCQKFFLINVSAVKKNGNFCSRKCAGIGKFKRTQSQCLTCDKLFFIQTARIKDGEGKFCSRPCYIVYARDEYKKHRKPTSIEIKIYEELTQRGIIFKDQHLINKKFWVDAFVPSKNLIIEADGDYWHSLPRQIGRDISRNAYLLKCGYKLLRLTETEINNNSFINKLEEVLSA